MVRGGGVDVGGGVGGASYPLWVLMGGGGGMYVREVMVDASYTLCVLMRGGGWS